MSFSRIRGKLRLVLRASLCGRPYSLFRCGSCDRPWSFLSISGLCESEFLIAAHALFFRLFQVQRCLLVVTRL
jgi:hypothetical protein